VTDSVTGRLHVSRRIEPGPFQLGIVPTPVFGPLDGPRSYLISCDRPRPLPPFEGSTRPREGCFTFRDAALTLPIEGLWDRQGPRYIADVGSPRDARVDPDGFFARERVEAFAMDMRWAGARASVLWVPVPPLRPWRLALRARAPNGTPVDVNVLVAGESAGTLRVGEGEFAESRLELPPWARDVLSGPEPVRIEFQSPTWSPKRAGMGEDPRELGIAVDRITLE
jgi:hypothetical protein